VETEDRDPCGSKDARVIEVLEITEAPENGHRGIRTFPTKKRWELNCIYANAQSMHIKQEELEAIVQRENYDIVTITET